MSATVANTKSVRKDPSKRRRMLGNGSLWNVKSRNPDKKHVWVYENNSEFGVQYYESAGWDVVKKGSQDVEFPDGIVKDGDVVRLNGHVLMSIDKEDFDDIQQRGMFGEGGQQLVDSIDKLIHNKGVDHQELQSDLVRVVNESGPTRKIAREEQPEG